LAGGNELEYQKIYPLLERLYDELAEAEKLLHPVLTRLREILGEFLGKMPPAPAPARAAVVEARKIEITAERTPRVEAPKVAVEVAPRIAEIPRVTMVKQVPFTEHLFTRVEQKIDDKERVFDLGGVYEAIIVVPEIDAYIEFDKPITDRTPPVAGGTALNAEIYVREVHYKSAIPGMTGELSVWAFR
jgi:hypothetical protein